MLLACHRCMSNALTHDEFSGSGHVVFVLYANGTKSESWRPFAVLPDGNTIGLHMEGDNPFTNDRLRPFHGCFCKFSGHFAKKKGLLLVSEIEKISDPFPASASTAGPPGSGGFA